MKKTLLILIIAPFFSCNLTKEQQDNWLNISDTQLDNNIANVSILTTIKNSDNVENDLKVLNNCSCKSHKDTLFILLNYNNGWQDYSTLGIIYKEKAEFYFTKSNDIDSRAIKLPQIQLTLDNLTNRILGIISLEYDTVIESSNVEIRALGKFYCEIEEATESWYYQTLTSPDGTRKYK